MRPTNWSCLPLMTVMSSSVSLPHCSLTLPVSCFQLPSTRSQFICLSSRCWIARFARCPLNVAILVWLPRKAWADFLCVAPGDCPHRERTIEDFTFVAGDLRSMIRDDIVALLPDLRAFSRFLCRERESADDLVQNTILSALDKQD